MYYCIYLNLGSENIFITFVVCKREYGYLFFCVWPNLNSIYKIKHFLKSI